MKEIVRLEIRLSKYLKHQLEAEAMLCEQSLNLYVVTILRFRKRTKKLVASNGGRYETADR